MPSNLTVNNVLYTQQITFVQKQLTATVFLTHKTLNKKQNPQRKERTRLANNLVVLPIYTVYQKSYSVVHAS